MKTAVEWLELELSKLDYDKMSNDLYLFYMAQMFDQAKEMEENTAQRYAEFCIRCDRANLPLVKFDDWRKELTF